MLKQFLVYSFAITLFFGAGFFGTNSVRKHYHSAPSHGNPAYVQVRASHMLTFLDEDGEDSVWCSGTVVGPHAILSASHCNPESDDFKTLNIDRSTAPYHIITSSFDGRDHMIILVDGAAFADIVPYVTRAPRMGEPVFIEGFGAEIYPSIEKRGKIVTSYDPSEIDAGQKMFFFDAPVIHGDSGSCVYGKDGAILGLVTWSIDDTVSAGYQLAFSDKIIHDAQTFDGKDSE